MANKKLNIISLEVGSKWTHNKTKATHTIKKVDETNNGTFIYTDVSSYGLQTFSDMFVEVE